MLRTRILTAAIWLPIHLTVLLLGKPYHFLIYLEGIAVIGMLEMFELLAAKGFRPHRLAVVLAGTVYLAAVAYKPGVAFAAAAGLALVVLGVPVLRGRPEGSLADGAASLIAFAYVPVLLGFLVLVRRVDAGVTWILVFFLVIWIVDTAAYATGRALGRRSLAPFVSPKKTWEGTLGGFAAGLIVTPILCVGAFPKLGVSWWAAAVLGLVIACGDLVGDLAESAFKRDVGVKDSGNLLPGHGGVLDRFDSVVYCAPLLFVFVYIAGAVR